MNPSVLVEVTSDSTEAYDRSEKLRHYEQLPGLQCVLVVSHRERRVTVHRRDASGWVASDETVAFDIDALRTRVAVDDLYRLADLSAR